MHEALSEWGLSDKEIAVYLFLLQHKDANVQHISKHTGVLRQTVYEILPNLERLGLVSHVRQNKKLCYNANNPSVLVSKLDEKKSSIQAILPSLESFVQLSASSSRAQVYDGVQGIRSIFADALSVGKPIKFILPIRGEEKIREFFVSSFMKKRVEQKIPMHILRGGIKSDYQKGIATNAKEFRKVRFLETVLPLEIQIGIYGNKMFIASFGENLFGVVIEDPIITTSFDVLFETLWQLGKDF